MTQQGRRLNLDIVDHDLLSKKENKKALKAAGYSMGIGVGFFILSPGLFGIGDEQKSEAVMHAFHVLGSMLILYAVALIVGYFFLRDNLKLIRFGFAGMVLPMTVIWSGTEIYKVLMQ